MEKLFGVLLRKDEHLLPSIYQNELQRVFRDGKTFEIEEYFLRY